MRSLIRWLTQPWLITFVGALLIALLIWFVGPLIAVAGYAPLGDFWIRTGAVGAVFLIWAVHWIIRIARSQARDRQMVLKVTEGPSASETEVLALRKRFEDAARSLKLLAGKRSGPRYLYELPWYILIGPPGAGKTTALTRSGVRFLNTEGREPSPADGVGGTRSCDWWFAEDAVLIDTAGRYVTQDSHEEADQSAWLGFVDLLKKYRPRQPINGAVVGISLVELAALSDQERQNHAKAVRKRLVELVERLGIAFPVYTVFTKLDRVAGFVEFFDGLSREEREQVWGVTFPFSGSLQTTAEAAQFGEKFDALLARLGDLKLERLQQESDLRRRALIFGFPSEMAGLRAISKDFLDEVFQPTRFQAMPSLRGVYFSSGVQEGTPIDRIMGTLARSVGMGESRVANLVGGGRSYFLSDLLKKVVFVESSLVSTDPVVERRQRWTHRGAYGLMSAGLILCAAAWTSSSVYNLSLIRQQKDAVPAYLSAVSPFADRPQSDPDPMPILPALDHLQALATADASGAPWLGSFGLYQGHKLAAAGKTAYRRALNSLFLPRLVIRAGQQVTSAGTSLSDLRGALKVYLMLGGLGPLDTGLITTWFKADWDAQYPGDENAALRSDLAAQLDALLSNPLSPVTLDGALVDAAQRRLTSSPLPAQAYAMIETSPEALALPAWRVIDHAGPASDRTLRRISGKPLSTGVDGIYTYDGYTKVFLPSLAHIVRMLIDERWVTGTPSQPLPTGNATAIEEEVDQLYEQDFIQAWDQLLGDISVAPFTSGPAAAEIVGILSGPTSPLKILLTDIVHETRLTRPLQAAGAGLAVPAAVPGQVNQIISALSSQQPVRGAIVEQHYKALSEFVGAGTGPAPVDDLLRNLGDLYLQLNRLAQPGQDLLHGAASADGAAALQKLQAGAAQLPPPVAGLVGSMGQRATALTAGGARDQVRTAWESDVRQYCDQAMAQGYPVSPSSPDDVKLDDFIRLFSPSGLINGFVTGNLLPYIDTSASSWRSKQLGGVDLGLGSGALAQFQRAARIRDGFFPPGNPQPGLRFFLTPAALDPGTREVVLEVDGQSISYTHGVRMPATIQWPPSGGLGQVRLAFLDGSGTNTAALNAHGPWAWFRLLDQGVVEQRGPGALHVTFSAGGHSVSYDVQAASVLTPLTLNDLAEFRCPRL